MSIGPSGGVTRVKEWLLSRLPGSQPDLSGAVLWAEAVPGLPVLALYADSKELRADAAAWRKPVRLHLRLRVTDYGLTPAALKMPAFKLQVIVIVSCG
jgi:hypothetical protein